MEQTKTKLLRAFKIIISIILLIYITNGCVTTKSTSTSRTEIQKIKDSLRMVSLIEKRSTSSKVKVQLVTKAIHSNTVIPLECDEEGNVKPINHKTKSGNNYSNTSIKDNKLFLDTYIDSITNTKTKIIKTFYERQIDSLSHVIDTLKETNTAKETVKTKSPFWAHIKCGVIVLLLLIALYFAIRRK